MCVLTLTCIYIISCSLYPFFPSTNIYLIIRIKFTSSSYSLVLIALLMVVDSYCVCLVELPVIGGDVPRSCIQGADIVDEEVVVEWNCDVAFVFWVGDVIIPAVFTDVMSVLTPKSLPAIAMFDCVEKSFPLEEMSVDASSVVGPTPAIAVSVIGFAWAMVFIIVGPSICDVESRRLSEAVFVLVSEMFVPVWASVEVLKFTPDEVPQSRADAIFVSNNVPSKMKIINRGLVQSLSLCNLSTRFQHINFTVRVRILNKWCSQKSVLFQLRLFTKQSLI